LIIKVSDNFVVFIQDWHNPYEYGYAGIKGESAYILEYEREGGFCYRILCEGKTFVGGRGYINLRILGKRALAVLSHTCKDRLKRKEDVISSSGLRLRKDTDYCIRQMFAEDGLKVVEFNIRGEMIKNYVTNLDLH
jgi:hypothetical protein